MSTSGKKTKVNWDGKLTELYIKICVQEVRSGNRPTTHLSKQGMINLEEKINKLAKKNFDRKQLKNKWDNLKKDWQLWKRLTSNDIGLGWNANRRTIEADDAWWEAKIKEIPLAAKFREKGLLFADEMEILFGDVVVSGEYAWTPSSGVLPQAPQLNILEGSGENNEIIGKEPRIEIADDSDLQRSTSKGKDKGLTGCSLPSHLIKKKRYSNSISMSLERISGIAESIRPNMENHSMKACLNVITSVGIEENSQFYYQCLLVLSKHKDYRKMLLCLDKPEIQLGYLHTIVNDDI